MLEKRFDFVSFRKSFKNVEHITQNIMTSMFYFMDESVLK